MIQSTFSTHTHTIALSIQISYDYTYNTHEHNNHKPDRTVQEPYMHCMVEETENHGNDAHHIICHVLELNEKRYKKIYDYQL